MTGIITILLVSMLIILHELGHYAVARACGMRVTRFSVGFGPSLFSFRLGETIWQIAAIPVGGFVQILGMAPDEGEGDPASFRNRPAWQRALVMLAGPFANWLTAAACIALVAVTVGFRDIDESRAAIGDVAVDGAAAKAGLQPGDLIVSINGAAVTDWQTAIKAWQQHPQETLRFDVKRQETALAIDVTPNAHPQTGMGYIGVDPPYIIRRVGLASGISMGFSGAWRVTERQAQFLWTWATGNSEGSVSGLPGIVKMLSAQAERGAGRLFESVAMLSIALFLFNLLPLPALDGGRIVFVAVEAIRRRPVNQVIEGWVHAVGMIVLIAFMIFVSIRDLL